MNRYTVLSECIECVRSWELMSRYPGGGYKEALQILEALREGLTPVPASEEYVVDYAPESAETHLYRLIGFLQEADYAESPVTEEVIETLHKLANHTGNIMFVTDPALLPVDYTEDVPEPVSKILVNTGVTDVTTTSFKVNITLDEVCELFTYVDTFIPPTTQVRHEASLNYASHSGSITGLQPNTKYYIQPVAKFANGTYVYGNVVSQTTAEQSAGLNTSGMQSINLGNDKGIGTVTDANIAAMFSPLVKKYALTDTAKMGVGAVAGRKSLTVRLSSTNGTDSKPTNRMDTGYRLPPNRSYRVKYDIYVGSNFVGGGLKNGKPFGTGKLLMGLYAGNDVSGGIKDPAGCSLRVVWDILPDNSITLSLYDYSVDRSSVWGDRILLPQKLIRGQHATVAFDYMLNSNANLSDGRIRAWQGSSSTPVVTVTGKKGMGSGTPLWNTLKLEVFGGGSGANALKQYGLPSDQDISFSNIFVGSGTF